MTRVATEAPFETARDAANAIGAKTGREQHDVAVVLGSGWAPAAERLGHGAEVPMADIPGFLPPTVAGHAGLVRSVDVDGHGVLVLVGRTHLYEGQGVERVVHAVRAAVLGGCRAVILTNAAGGVDPSFTVGQPVLLADHLNLSGHNPLVGPGVEDRFVDLSDVYSERLRGLARSVDPSLVESVYAMFMGPSYETKAEVRMAGALGAGLVGMSTALEAIAARHLGAEVLGLSLVTNPAAGVVAQPIHHGEVLQAGRDAADRLGDLLLGIVRAIVAA